MERHAPGFRDRIQAAVAMRPADLEVWNPNLVGGDIAGGSLAGARALLRPTASPRPHRAGTAWPRCCTPCWPPSPQRPRSDVRAGRPARADVRTGH